MSRSGSATRQRNLILTARFNEQEAAAVRAMAENRGQSVSEMLRCTLLGIRPRPSRIDQEAYVRLRGDLGRINGNLNQIAKHLNAGRPGDTMTNLIQAAVDDLLEHRLAIQQALGKEPDRKIKDE